MRERGRPSGVLLAVSGVNALVAAFTGLVGNVVTGEKLPFGLEAFRDWAPNLLLAGLALVVVMALLQAMVGDRQSNEPEAPEEGGSRAWLWAVAAAGALAAGLVAARAAGWVPGEWQAASLVGAAVAGTATGGIVGGRYVWWRRRLKPLPEALRGLLERQRQEAASRHHYDYALGSAPPLLEIYVEQRADHLPTALPVARAGAMTLAEMLAAGRHALVVADPGVGKSTAVARVLQEQAAWWLAARRSARPERAPYGPSIPISLPADLRGRSTLPDAMAAECGGLGARWFKAPPPGARSWLVLIDGLDQILVTRERRAVLERLGQWIARAPDHYRFMITTRPLLGSEVGLLSAPIDGYALQRFSEQGLRTFAERWAAYRGSRHVPGIERPVTVERFLTGVAASKLTTLVRTPLIATITALLLEWSQETALPTGRAGLYDTYVQHLFGARRLDEAVSGTVFTAGQEGERAWTWLRENLRTILEHVADRHLSPGTPPVVECAVECILEQAPKGMFYAVAGWKAALPPLLTATSLITLRDGALAFIHPSFAEYLAAGPRADSFDLETWLADARGPDSRSLALFVLARLAERRPGTATADSLVELLLERGGADVNIAGAIVADGIGVRQELRRRVTGELFQRLRQEDQTTAEAVRVLADLTTDPDVMDRLAAFVTDQDNPDWVRADVAEALCGVARTTGVRLLRHVLGATGDAGLRHRILVLLIGYGEATDAERARAAGDALVFPDGDTSGDRAGEWYRQVAGSPNSMPRHRLYALVMLAYRRESGWEAGLVEAIEHAELTPQERLDAARAVAQIGDGTDEPEIVTRLRAVAADEERPLDIRVPLLAALATEQDEPARHQLNRVAATFGAGFRTRYPFVAALQEEVGARTSERDPTAGAVPMRRLHGLPIRSDRIPEPSTHFSGRDTLLSLMGQRFAEGASAQVLHGWGGAGKTEIAIEYCYRHHGDYDVVWWVPADEPELIPARIAALAPGLGLPPAEVAGVAGAADAVLGALRDGTPFQRWLLVYDNVGDPKDLEGLVPEGPGHVLVTSRRSDWGPRFERMECLTFDRTESVAFLTRVVGAHLDAEEADELADELGDLPLALRHAASLMATTGMQIREYLTLLREPTVHPLRHDASVPASMRVAWTMSVDALRRDDPDAVELLRVLAFFGPEPVPRDLFSTPVIRPVALLENLRHNPIRLSHAVRALLRYALITYDPGYRTIQVHRLIQSMMRDLEPEEEQERIREQARLLVASYVREDPYDPTAWKKYGSVADHLEALSVEESTDADVRDLALRRANHLSAAGDYAGARSLAERLVETWTAVSSPADPHVMRARLLLTGASRRAGVQSSTYELDLELLTFLEDQESGRHPLMPLAVRGVAAALRARGDFEEAESMTVKALAQARGTHGDDHPLTVLVRCDTALSVCLTGDYEQALRFSEETFTAASRLDGHVGLRMKAWEVMACCLRSNGRPLEARDTAEEVFQYSTEVLGFDHPRTLRAGREFAIGLRQVGEFDSAEDLALRVHATHLRSYGSRHPETIAALIALSHVRRSEMSLAKEVVAGYAETLGAEHPFYYAAMGNLALRHRYRRLPAAARSVDERALAGLVTRLGRDHPYALAVAVNLASDLAESGDIEAASQLGTDTEERLRRVLGPAHPTTLACGANLRLDRARTASRNERKVLLEETFRLYADTLGVDHPDAGRAARNERVDVEFDPLPL
ncbi:FxSxx-COOH system tetratricopeptide repeat protein [Nonomuraea sp. NPDC049421]|uniref:FxSxx-COOH system tetratricopeptide repeat protein n=1 Tax=Nonomuraea sp. NPDC049421 TaxID=3155275 RepID=UPI0034160238